MLLVWFWLSDRVMLAIRMCLTCSTSVGSASHCVIISSWDNKSSVIVLVVPVVSDSLIPGVNFHPTAALRKVPIEPLPLSRVEYLVSPNTILNIHVPVEDPST